MEHEGMVHALEKIHDLLEPDGCLIDIHPFIGKSFVEVHQRGKVMFAEPVPPFDEEYIRHAEDSLAQVVRRRLFIIERAAAFDFLTYAPTIHELLEFYEEANAFDQSLDDGIFKEWASKMAVKIEEAMRDAGEGAEVAYREWAHISRLDLAPGKT
jgi:hypothetical protein